MKLSFFRTPAAVLLLGCAMLAATASAAEANTGRVLQDTEPTMAPTPVMMMPSHDDHDDHDDHDHSEAPSPAPVMAEGDGAAALGGANTLVAAVGCALAAAAGAVAVL